MQTTHIRIGRPDWNSKKIIWVRVLRTDETKINLYQSDGKANVWRKKGSAHDPKHTSSSVKEGGGNIMASSGLGSLIFTDDVTHEGSSKMQQRENEGRTPRNRYRLKEAAVKVCKSITKWCQTQMFSVCLEGAEYFAVIISLKSPDRRDDFGYCTHLQSLKIQLDEQAMSCCLRGQLTFLWILIWRSITEVTF